MANQAAQTRQRSPLTDQPDDAVSSTRSESRREPNGADLQAVSHVFLRQGEDFVESMVKHINSIHLQFLQTWMTVSDEAIATADMVSCKALTLVHDTADQASSAVPLLVTPFPIPEAWSEQNKKLISISFQQIEMLQVLQRKIAESALLPVRCYVRAKRQD